MKVTRMLCISALGFLFCASARPQSSSAPSFPYSPSLNLESIDKSIDPCVNLYQYSCGRWQKDNPIPPDQTSWSVYGKLYQDNLNFLHGILEQAADAAGQRDAVTQKIGDFYAACIDETAVEKHGIEPIKSDLGQIEALKAAHDLAPLLAHLHTTLGSRALLFTGGSDQDPDNSEQVIASLDQGGLGLPDRDYYTKTDAKSEEIRQNYLAHMRQMFRAAGRPAAAAAKPTRRLCMSIETALAQRLADAAWSSATPTSSSTR